jgi:DNA-directed RNA polymerase alpha subunit
MFIIDIGSCRFHYGGRTVYSHLLSPNQTRCSTIVPLNWISSSSIEHGSDILISGVNEHQYCLNSCIFVNQTRYQKLPADPTSEGAVRDVYILHVSCDFLREESGISAYNT